MPEDLSISVINQKIDELAQQRQMLVARAVSQGEERVRQSFGIQPPAQAAAIAQAAFANYTMPRTHLHGETGFCLLVPIIRGKQRIEQLLQGATGGALPKDLSKSTYLELIGELLDHRSRA